MISDSSNDLRTIHNLHTCCVIHWRSLLVVWMTTLFVGTACKQNPEIHQETLYGKWDVWKAERNGKQTDYLRGGYFVIEKNGSVTVNITGSEEKGLYTLSEKTLRVNGSKDFVIESLETDSLRLRFAMSPDNEFLFYLYRNTDED